ncbi:SRPBCC family protein [Azospirillum sp. sgz302134]
MRRIDTAIRINAPASVVWTVLTDTARYPDWNPFIRSLEGDLATGARLRVRIAPDGAAPMTFRPTVLLCEAGRELRWLGRVLLPGLFDGEHAFRIEPDGAGVCFRHEERFRGLLVAPLWIRMAGPTRAGFEAMNRALKQRAEALAQGNAGGRAA